MQVLRWLKGRLGAAQGAITSMATAAAATTLLAAVTASPLSAQEPVVRAYLEPPEVEVGGQFTLRIEVSGASEVENVVISPARQLPFARAATTFPFFDASEGVPLPFTTEITAATAQSPGLVTFSYPLLALETGFFDIGPFQVTADGRTLETERAMLMVTSPDAPTVRARFEPSEVRLMETFQLVVEAPGLDASLNDVILPDLSSFARQGTAASSHGAIYQLVATRPGTHEVGPISVSVGGEVYETEPLTLVVSEEHRTIEARATLNTDRAWVGGEFVLSVEARGVEKLEEDPVLPELSGFAELLSGGSSGYGFGNGEFTTSASYRFRALTPGDFEIGPVTVTTAGQTVRTEPVRLTITDVPPDPFVSPEQLRAIATIETQRVFVGEPVFVSYQVLARDGPPSSAWSVYEGGSFTPPEHQDFQIHNLDEQPGSILRRISVDGRAFRAATRHLVALVPLQPGEKTVGPAEFQVQVNTREPFGVGRNPWEEHSRARMMGEWTPVTLATDPVSVEVVPLPAEGRPESFRGHVGRVAVASWLDRTEARVGDTVILRVVVTGNAYLRLMPDPEIIVPEGFEISEPEVSDDPPRLLVGESAERTLVYRLVPTREGAYRIPAVEVSWFDPETEEYGVARAEPFDLAVGPAGRE